MALWNEMTREQYPFIEMEQTTITLIIRGLRARPSMKTYIPALLIQNPQTLRELRNTLVLLQSIDSPHLRPPINNAYPRLVGNQRQKVLYNKWCDFHQMICNHTTNECIALQYQRENDNPAKPEPENEDQPRVNFARGRGGARARY